jgi:hypothetical protein
MTGGDTGEGDEGGCRIQERAHVRARESLKSHVRWLDNCDSSTRGRLAACHANARCNRSSVATTTLWSLQPKASSPRNADGRPAQVVDVRLRGGRPVGSSWQPSHTRLARAYARAFLTKCDNSWGGIMRTSSGRGGASE